MEVGDNECGNECDRQVIGVRLGIRKVGIGEEDVEGGGDKWWKEIG
jgi:hypothetical protein